MFGFYSRNNQTSRNNQLELSKNITDHFHLKYGIKKEKNTNFTKYDYPPSPITYPK